MRSSITIHFRLVLAAAVGIAAGMLLPAGLGLLVRAISGWNITATLYLVLVARAMLRATPTTMRARAKQVDESGWTLLFVGAAAATFSLCASLGLLADFKQLPSSAQLINLALAIYTILISWCFLHILFAVHYAAAFYAPGAHGKDRGGLVFPGTAAPGYLEFVYFSLTIGMTAQTSDTGISSTKLRLLALAHSVLTFFFNTVVVALSINIAASAL